MSVLVNGKDTPKNVIKAVQTLKEFCKSRPCSQCPFGIWTNGASYPFFECGLKEDAPVDWMSEHEANGVICTTITAEPEEE